MDLTGSHDRTNLMNTADVFVKLSQTSKSNVLVISPPPSALDFSLFRSNVTSSILRCYCITFATGE